MYSVTQAGTAQPEPNLQDSTAVCGRAVSTRRRCLLRNTELMEKEHYAEGLKPPN